MIKSQGWRVLHAPPLSRIVCAVGVAIVSLVITTEQPTGAFGTATAQEHSTTFVAVHRPVPRWRPSRNRRRTVPVLPQAVQQVPTARPEQPKVPTWFDIEMEAVTQPQPAGPAVPPVR